MLKGFQQLSECLDNRTPAGILPGRRTAFLAFVLCHAVLAATQALAAFPCDELWGERNAVYAEAGYCFRTPRGIKVFGNAGCRFDNIQDVPLSARDRQKVSYIVRQEQLSGCRE